jgi:hypothetical protein
VRRLTSHKLAFSYLSDVQCNLIQTKHCSVDGQIAIKQMIREASLRSKSLLVAVALSLATLNAAVIDFEDQPVGSYAGDTVTITVGGAPVTVTGPGLRIRQFTFP